MKNSIYALLTLAVALLCAPSFAAEAPTGATGASGVSAAPASAPAVVMEVGSMDTNKDGKVDNAELKTYLEKDAKATDLLSDTVGAVKGVAKAKAEWETEKLLALATALAGIFKLLLSLIKMLGNSKLPWLATSAGKNTVKYSTLLLGVLAGLCANLAGGVSVAEALLLVGSGPLAVAIHEYMTPSKKEDTPSTPA